MKLLLVNLGRGRYAVAADVVARILDPATEIDFHLENRSREVTYRGSRIRVASLHGEQQMARVCVYLVLEVRGRRALLPVDDAEAIRDVPAAAIAPLPPFIFARQERSFRGVFSDRGEARLVLDVENIL